MKEPRHLSGGCKDCFRNPELSTSANSNEPRQDLSHGIAIVSYADLVIVTLLLLTAVTSSIRYAPGTMLTVQHHQRVNGRGRT